MIAEGGPGDCGHDASTCCRKRSSGSDTAGPHCHTKSNEGDVHEMDEVVMNKKARNALIGASIACVIFVGVEVAGGVLANSLAIATDAAHLLTDVASFMVSLFALWLSSRPPTRAMSFGWHRAEVLGAIISVLFIWVMTAILCYMAAMRLIEGNYDIDAEVMLITSCMAIVFNIIMGVILSWSGHGHTHGGLPAHHGHSHGGGHGHGHAEDDIESSRERLIRDQPQMSCWMKCMPKFVVNFLTDQKNINVRSALIHVIGDLVQSIGVVIAATILYFEPTWVIVDPICTFIFSVIVLFTTVKILKDTLHVLMEATPKGITFEHIEQHLLAVEGIVAVHNLRLWSLTTSKNAMAAHIVIRPGKDPLLVLGKATETIRKRVHNFHDMTLQVESYKDDMDRCGDCQNPGK